MSVFFNSPRNIGLNREIPYRRDALKTYYEKGSVLWKNCAWGRDNSFRCISVSHPEDPWDVAGARVSSDGAVRYIASSLSTEP